MNAKDFRNVLLFMCNRWDETECSMIFNEFPPCDSKYVYSLGWHIWNKWIEDHDNHHGPIDCITFFILEALDTECLQKLINRSIEYYNK